MASNTDKLRKSYSFLQKSLGGSIGDSDNSLTLNNYTNIPTDTAVDFIIDRIDANGNRTNDKRELVTGVCTGSAITGLVRGLHGTTAQAHDGGAIVEFVTSSKAWNDLIDSHLQEHNQDGTHGDTTHDSVSTDTVNEKTSGHGVDIDGLNVKDGKITTPAAIDTTQLADKAVTPSKLDLAPGEAIVSTSQSTTSSSFTDLGTVGPEVTVNIGTNGVALVAVYAQMDSGDVGNRPEMGFAVSGASTVSPSASMAIASVIASGASSMKIGGTFLVTGLTAGSNTFTAKYRRQSGSGNSTFANRRIVVVPL